MLDWLHWLRHYDRPHSPLAQRLALVQQIVSGELDGTAPSPSTVLSICAGDGRDILDVLAQRHDAERVSVSLVDIDPYLCMLARTRARRHSLKNVTIRRGDAGITDTYVDLEAANIVIAVGMFGNMSNDCMGETIATLPALCKRAALVVWGRRNEADAIAIARQRFIKEGFEEVHTSGNSPFYYVGSHRFLGLPTTLLSSRRFFAFNNDGQGGREDP